MKAFFVALALIAGLIESTGAQTAAQAGVVTASPTVALNRPEAARVLWLDKQTNVKKIVILEPAVAQTLGPMALRLERCVADLQNQPGTDAAWLVVSEPDRGTDWFTGWMINTLPEVATLDHPRYDVQLVGCGSEARRRAGPVARSGKPVETGVDMESTAASGTALGGEAFVVPGVTDVSTPTQPEPAVPEPVPANMPTSAPANADTPADQEGLHQFIDSLPPAE